MSTMENIKEHASRGHDLFFIMGAPYFDLRLDTMEILFDLVDENIYPDDVDPEMMEELADKDYIYFDLDHDGDIDNFLFLEDNITNKLDILYNIYLIDA